MVGPLREFSESLYGRLESLQWLEKGMVRKFCEWLVSALEQQCGKTSEYNLL